MPLYDGMVLYHGSFREVGKPRLSFGTNGDFGQSFYLTSSGELAQVFEGVSVRRAFWEGRIGNHGFGVVSSFCCRAVPGLRIFEYPILDAQWLHCAAGNRRRGLLPNAAQGGDIDRCDLWKGGE